ncbi:MAG: RNA-binding protein [Dehalococcoidales bacterium]|nr:RNA-binding protein [Dehalococcoidales bacterium]
MSNLSFDVTEEELRHEFEAYGEVVSVIIVKNKFDGISRGEAFIEMLRNSDGLTAVPGLNGKILEDRAMVVKAVRNWSELRKYSRSRQQKPHKI